MGGPLQAYRILDPRNQKVSTIYTCVVEDESGVRGASSEIHYHSHSFEEVQLWVVLTTPLDSRSLCRLVTVLDQNSDCGLVRVLQELIMQLFV